MLVLVAMLTAPGAVRAADELSITPALDRAVAHLEATQLPDGGFGSRLALRDSATVGDALRLVDPDSPAIAGIDAYLSGASVDDVDSLSRAAIGSPSSGRAGELLATQREDGGFGLSLEYQSDPLDTALALRALSALGEREAARRAAGRLVKFAIAGVWGDDGGDVALTSEALLGVDAYVRRFGSTAALDATRTASATWLGAVQDDAGTWGSGQLGVRTTALAVSALSSSLSAVTRVSAGADALLLSQQPDGSWGDPFSTALALRALQQAGDLIERDRVTQLPDPSVRSVDVRSSPRLVDSGDPVTVTATIANTGRATASDLTAELFLDDPAGGAVPVATADVPDLPAGARAPVSTTFDVSRAGGRARVYVVVRAPVDADRDLTNNTAEHNLFVRLARNAFPRTRDWPRQSRDLQRSGSTPNRLHAVVDSEPIWRASGATGGHIVAEGRVYYGAAGQIAARDAKTGALVWRAGFSYVDDRYRTPVYTRGWILTAAEGTAGPLVAKTGVLEGGVGGWGGDRPIFAAETIEVERSNDPTFMYMANLPWINNDEKCHLVPYRDMSGVPWSSNPWSGKSPIYTYQGPPEGWLFFRHKCDGDPLSFSADGPRAFMTNGAWVSGFDPKDARGPNGEEMLPLFDTKLPDTTKVPAAALVDSLNQVIVAGWEGTSPSGTEAAGTLHTGRGKVVAVDPANGSVYWTFSTNAQLDGTPVEYKGTVVVIDRSGRVYGLDQITGALKWSWMPGDYVPPPPADQGKSGQTLAISGRYLYVPHPDGRVYTLDARDGSQLSSTMFSGRPYELAIDDTNNALYVRTLDGFVGAYPTREQLEQCAPDPLPAAPVAGPVERVSNGGVTYEPPAISSDGRHIAYTTGSPRQIHIRDLQAGTTESLPASDPLSPRPRTDKHFPVLSDDGRHVGFLARQYDTVYNWDADMMFVQDRQTGVVDPVLRHPNGAPMSVQIDGQYLQPTDQQSFAMSMSGDGQRVAFASGSNSIVPGDTNSQWDVFVIDRATGTRTRVAEGNGPALSSDGRFVAFTSYSNLTGAPVASWSYDGSPPYVYRYELATGELRLVSATPTGAAVSGYSPRMSGDGRYVAFVSDRRSMYPSAFHTAFRPGYSQDAFVWDATTGGTEYVSLNDTGRHTPVAVTRPSISDDGRHATFVAAGNFTKGMTSYTSKQVIGRDRQSGRTRLLSPNPYGSSGGGQALAPVMSGDGSRVAFLSSSADLAPGTSGAWNVYLYERSREGAVPADPAEPDDANCPLAGDDARAYSDLSVAAADVEALELEQGQSGEVRVTVHNEGGAESEPTTVRLYAGDSLIGELPLPAIPAGATAQPAFTWERIATAGAHTLRVVVDPDALVYEQDLADNEAETIVQVAPPRLDLSAETDQPAYGANEPVAVTAGVGNRSLGGRDVRVQMTIEDESGDRVVELHDADVHAGAGEDVSVQDGWNTQDTTAGEYVVRVRAENADGDELATATTPLTIDADVRAALDLRTDRRVYDAHDTAAISALVENLSANSSLSGAQVEIAIATTGDAWDLPTGEIMLGRSTLVSQERSVRGLAPGTYEVTAVLRSADGTQLADDTAQLVIASTADTGAGLSGTLAAEPSDPHRFTRVAFPYRVTNDGNADIAGAVVRVRVSDVVNGTVLKTLDDPRALTRGAPLTGALSTVADMPADRDYQASLHLVLPSGAERALARTIIHVRPKLLDHGLSFATAPRDRVLVWACEPADEAAARTALGTTTFASYVIDRRDSRYATLPGCGALRDEELAHFRRFMRSGEYNQFWLLGRSLPFDLGIIDDELAARVIQGDGLLVAGGVPSLGLEAFTGANRSPLGASLSGAVPALDHLVNFRQNSPFVGLSARANGPFPGVTLEGASEIAYTNWMLVTEEQRLKTGTLNRFGQGTAIYLAPAPSAFVSSAAAVGFLRKASTTLRPAAEPARAAGMAWLDLFVEGVAPGSPMELRTQLPPGTSAPKRPADSTLTGTQLTLPFVAAGTQRKQRGFWLKLPNAAGDLEFGSSVFFRDPEDGQTKQYGEPATVTLHVAEDKASARTAALSALGAIVTPNATEQAKLQKIRDDVTATATSTTDPTVLEARIDALLLDVGTLEKSTTWTDTGSARTAVARLITYVEYDHYRTGGA